MIRSISLICVLLLFTSGKILAQCAACQYSVDLINNGDFQSGNTGFTTSLDYSPGPIFFCPLCDENTYAIGANATLYHSGFAGSDHTNPPSGNFFIANGPGQNGSLVWCQNLAVQPNTDYTFTFWGRDVTNNSNPHPYALLQASFNGTLSSDTLEANGGWEEFTMTWNSGSTTNLDLCIINQQSLTGGNDFGLDDISLTACYNYQLTQAAFAGDDVTICSDESIQLGQSSIAGYNYTWDNGSGLSSTTSSNPTLSINNVSTTPIVETYIVTRDSANVGCTATDTVHVTVLPMPEFSLGSDIVICPGETATLDAGSGWDNITWSTTEETQTVVAGQGNYTATVELNNCTRTDDVAVTEQVMPVIDLGADQNICSTTELTLDAGTTVLWSTGQSAQTLAIDAAGEYSALYTQGNCETSDTIFVAMTTPTAINLPEDTLFCEGTTLTLYSGVSGLWSTGDLGSSITVSQPAYYDIVVQEGPCISSAGTTVEMLPLPIVSLDDDESICEDDSLLLIAYDDVNDDYLWSTGDTIANIYTSGEGIYSVIVSNECGSATDSIEIFTYPCSWGLYIPSSFTPNDDLFNDSWSIQGYNVSNIYITVYNRFGDAIFTANDLGVPWYPSTGIYDDVYNYRVVATAYDGSNIEQTGHIYLLR